MANNPYRDREVLEIFIETVDELQASKFAKQIKDGIRVGLKAGNGVIISELAGPDGCRYIGCCKNIRRLLAFGIY